MKELCTGFSNISLLISKRYHIEVKFFLAGVLNTAVGLAAYPLIYFFTYPLNLHYFLILIFSQSLGIIFSFLTNKFLVFQTSGNYLSEIRKFLTIHLIYFFVNLVALPALVELAGMDPVWAQTLFAAVIIMTSYFWHSRITFNSGKAKS